MEVRFITIHDEGSDSVLNDFDFSPFSTRLMVHHTLVGDLILSVVLLVV